MTQVKPQNEVTLKRELTLPLVTLYGLGVTIGAGIYVLVGTTAAKAGFYAPVSFLLAAIATSFTGFSYAELATRYPVSAGEAAYVHHGLRSKRLSLLVGLMVAASGVVSAAAVSIGAAAYLGHFIALSPALLTIAIILLLGFATIWGIMESVIIACIFTLLEMVGLGLVIFIGLTDHPEALANIGQLIPPLELHAWAGIYSASLLAFFAFIGFEDIANVAEEVKNPRRVLPIAIFLTLLVSTLLYILVVAVVVLTVPMEALTTSSAPLSLVFENADEKTKIFFNGIAVIATLNGVLIQMIMASRVLYGLASRNQLPKILRAIHPRTRTPLNATLLVVALILVLALFLPIAPLAEATSTIVLTVFMLISAALIRLKWSGEPVGAEVFQVPLWVPVTGMITCLLLLLSGLT